MTEEVDFLILGAGLSGLAAAEVLGEQATVLERDDRPGGLVRAECFDGYWFDRVLHLLYFADAKTETRIRGLLGDHLVQCPPEAWVETEAGTVRFPFQMHLGGLPRETIVRCIADLAEVSYRRDGSRPANFQEMLLRTFGREMCETFLFPYNRKLWKRPLETLVPAGFTWNITPPDFDKVLRGALRGNDDFQAYNSSGWYPRPPHGSAVRGMEVLSRALARRAADLRLEHVVELIDLDRRLVIARHNDQQRRFRFRRGCLATLPLPRLIAMCQQAPEPLRRATRRLSCNRVLSVMLSVRGPRPSTRGHWRYYSDESVVFTRLIYMHEFDPATAPDDGWGLLVELVEPAERPPVPRDEVFSRVRSDVRKVGALPDGCEIIDTHLMLVDPAYVVFTVDNQATVESASEFLAEGGITTLGRYGRWEYSSMSQVMRDAFCWADEQLAASAQTIMI